MKEITGYPNVNQIRSLMTLIGVPLHILSNPIEHWVPFRSPACHKTSKQRVWRSNSTCSGAPASYAA